MNEVAIENVGEHQRVYSHLHSHNPPHLRLLICKFAVAEGVGETPVSAEALSLNNLQKRHQPAVCPSGVTMQASCARVPSGDALQKAMN
jgi:hypothetical protein